MQPYSREKLTDRQLAVLDHIISFAGATADQVHYFTNRSPFDIFPVDVAVVKPSEISPYFIVSTVGLSAYKPMNELARAELVILLPEGWKTDFAKMEYFWPVKMLQDISRGLINKDKGVFIEQLMELDEDDPYETTDFVGGIVTFPELMPLEFIEKKIDYDYTRFFELVPVTGKQVKKIGDIGADKFIQFDLHDADGPVLNVEVPDVKRNAGKKIDMIISHNERSLKGK